MKGRKLLAVTPAGVVASIAMACSGCAGGAVTVVARVGDVPITAPAVAHRMAVLGAGHPGRAQRMRGEALDEVIGEQWLTGELAHEGIMLSGEEVRQRVRKTQEASFPGGRGELAEFLTATGQTWSDMSERALVELASEKLRQRVWQQAPRATLAEVARYYAGHRQQYFVAEQRIVLITNRKHAAEIRSLRSEVEQNDNLAGVSAESTLARPANPTQPLERAIYAAKLNTLTGPLRQGADYYLFDVVRTASARYRVLFEVKSAIEGRLSDARRQAALETFVASWRARWRARTHCRPGYVVQKCSEYNGPRAPEGSASLT